MRLVTQAYTGWRAGDEQIARVEGHEPAHISDQLPDGKNHGPGVPGLHALLVEVQEHVKALRVPDFVGSDQPWTHRAEGVASLALVPLGAAFHLKGALGN